MDQKRYLDDSYTTHFEARVAAAEPVKDGCRVVLEETYFYPESGGQPPDFGTIGEARVLDVCLEGENVVHFLDECPAQKVESARIDWARRYDHMQQHTGQHLLTAALIELFDADTIGFHLGADTCTIDVTMPGISTEQIQAAEDMCSEWIAQSLPVTVEYVTVDEFHALPLRKKALPDHIEGTIRLVKVGDVDTAHCGGTHLRNTAELQLVKITGSERVRDTTRIHFLAGQRAIEDYRGKHGLLTTLSDDLTCGIEDLAYVIGKLRTENKEAMRDLKKAQSELATFRSKNDLADAESAGRYKILCKRYDGMDGAALKTLAGEMTNAEPALLFCGIGTAGERAALVLAAGTGFDGDLGAVIRDLLPLFDGKGGGRGNFAQGVGDPAKADAVLSAARDKLRELGARCE